MKIIHCVHDDDLMTVIVVSDSPFGTEQMQVVEDVKQVFVTDPVSNKIEVEKSDE